MNLTATAVKNAKPRNKQYKISDGHGLYLLVKTTGKYWRYDYRFEQKRKTLALGVYPDVTLREARDKHFEARKALLDEIDPALQRRINKSIRVKQVENSFEVIALEWLDKKQHGWVESHYQSVKQRLHNHILPHIGNNPVSEINAPELLSLLKILETKGHYETAHRVRSICSQIFRYAIVTGRAERDPAADLIGALTTVKATSFAAITKPEEITGLLRAIEDYSGDMVTQCALRLAPLVFVRPGELRHAEWSEIDLKKNEWIIPAEKMKMKSDHIVPLSKQSLVILKEINALTGDGKYVFPSIRSRSRPMSENTVNAALRRMGFTREEMTGHGFRTMASTLLNEQGYNTDWIETQLAHAERNKIRAAYNRAKYLPQRKKMMQDWADYLEKLLK